MSKDNLPYDAGNAGDLLKHGLVAEFVRWYCDLPECGEKITFLDPFGGLPCHEAESCVKDRVEKLRGFALFDAQPDIAQGKYYGSGRLFHNSAKCAGKHAEVLVSDCDEEKRCALIDSGMVELKRHGFDPADGYSVLDCASKDEVVLIDPFSKFLPCKAAEVMPKIACASEYATVILFVLNLTPENPVGRKYRELKEDHLSNAWSLHCPPMKENRVKGESTFHVEVLLASPHLQNASANILRDKLSRYAAALGDILKAHVRLYPPKLPPGNHENSRRKKHLRY